MQRRPILYKLFLFGAVLASCTKGMEQMNVNPNESTNTQPEYLLSTVMSGTAYGYQQDAYFDKPASAGRYITMVLNEGNDKFNWGGVDWGSTFSRLSTNHEMMKVATKQGQLQYVTIGKIFDAFNFAYLTDLYGDIPYTEALQLKETRNSHPKYDQQKDIYPALLKELKDANDELANTKIEMVKSYDPMYNGNYTQWRKFANSLRLRMLLRISKNYPNAFTEMQEIINDPQKYPIFISNNDNAELPYYGAIKDNSWPGGPLNGAYSEFDKRKPSKEVVDFLLQRNDPRLQVWIAPRDSAQPAFNGRTVDNKLYVGVPNAVTEPYLYNGGNGFMSRLNPTYSLDKSPLVKASMMTYSEVCFILAEVVQAGKVTVPNKTAEDLYLEGIKSSMRFYGVEQAAINADYFKQASVIYNGTLEQLIGQKWISNFLKGSEGWFDHRRTGYPAFVLGPVSAFKVIPKRYMYPLSELSNNADQYNKAVSVFGKDDQFTLMWYLK
ncbi:SusD/RagB family nutrient-binding outer membrane lipoprotein [Chitinophaga silvatica]|uniref:SusD/RagB family nutrient-binding outer membrane lipoprotein n=1 Tax=Chitinophaga silvatica TaxID=2282649 RepID=A0A3E1Y966_9BACT|nr:SusD/RagB family nutrient-binding outer membrane lipoprotein [Chitinophaga silvatica]RFS21930.1 SusD/RagB family nutrient-binding outer membrane lipoprotein [Chitinophaga silvatica]